MCSQKKEFVFFVFYVFQYFQKAHPVLPTNKYYNWKNDKWDF